MERTNRFPKLADERLREQRRLAKARKQEPELIDDGWPERLHDQLAMSRILRGREGFDDRHADGRGNEGAGRIGHERIDPQLPGNAGILEHAVDDVSKPAVAHERDEVLAGEVARFDERPRTQAMAVRNHANRIDLAQDLVPDRRVVDRHHRDADVGLLRCGPFGDLVRAAQVKADVDQVVRLQELGDDSRDVSLSERRHAGDGQHAGAKVAQLAREAGDAFHADEHAVDLAQQCVGLGAGRQAFLAPREESHPDGRLEVRQQLADRGLRQVELLRRIGDTAGVHDCLERLDLPECRCSHRPPPSRSIAFGYSSRNRAPRMVMDRRDPSNGRPRGAR